MTRPGESESSAEVRHLGWVDWTWALGIYLAALALYSLYGPRGQLLHDHALFVYSGQRLVEGVPPYVSLFDHKGPLGPFLCALGIEAGRWVGVDDVLAVRALFTLVCGATASGVFLLTRGLASSRTRGVMAAATFLAFRGYGVQVASGPEPKTLAILLSVLAMAALTRRRVFAAGCLGSLAALTWQPSGIYCLATLVLAWTRPAPGRERKRSVAIAAIGVLLPLALVSAYFVHAQAFTDFVDGLLVFNVRYVEHTGNLKQTLGFLLAAVYLSYQGTGVAIALGLVTLGVGYALRTRLTGRGGLQLLFADPHAPVLCTFPLAVLWTLSDFQGYADLFLLLPYAALGFGWFLDGALSSLASPLGPRGRTITAGLALGALLSCSFFVYAFKHPTSELEVQRREAKDLVGDLPEGAGIVSLGAPEVLVLTHRRNLTRYGFLLRGVPRFIEAREPGGFAGWLETLDGADLVLVNSIALPLLRDGMGPALEAWTGKFEERPGVGLWRVYRRRP